ncbi:MAG TPA: HD domain-containing phosphohydrolase [Solirubrobacteraceae bacterium]
MGLLPRSPDGHGRGRLGLGHRAALIAAQAELARYFEESLELLWTADPTGRLVRVNPAWRRCLGHAPEAMRGCSLTAFIHVADRDGAAAEILSLADGSRDSVTARSRFQTLEGGHVWLEWSARSSVADGQIRGSAHDVTAQRRAEMQLADEARRLQAMVDERTRDLNEARAETLQLLAVASEYRDDETSLHTERIGELAAAIGARMGLSRESVALLREAAPLHDIGKLAIPDSVLLKPGRLSDGEQELMQTHTTLGARLLFGSRSPALQLAGVVAESHHEWWDGGGYPQGLIGDDIPLVGRIVEVADVFDALTHERPYKPAWPAEQAVALIRSSSGTQFDPRVVGAFLEILAAGGDPKSGIVPGRSAGGAGGPQLPGAPAGSAEPPDGESDEAAPAAPAR